MSNDFGKWNSSAFTQSLRYENDANARAKKESQDAAARAQNKADYEFKMRESAEKMLELKNQEVERLKRRQEEINLQLRNFMLRSKAWKSLALKLGQDLELTEEQLKNQAELHALDVAKSEPDLMDSGVYRAALDKVKERQKHLKP